MLSMCHAQQDAASHLPRQDIELSSCAKAPTDRAAPRGFILPAARTGREQLPRAASTGMMEWNAAMISRAQPGPSAMSASMPLSGG
jgi:hypothetical protein